MHGVILSTTSGWKSSRRIYEHVSSKGAILDQRVMQDGKSVFKRFENSQIKDFKVIRGFGYKDDIVLIRYGTTAEVACGKSCLTYNRSSVIDTISNKRHAREILQKAGIEVPELIPADNPKGIYPIIARRDFHERGEDLYVCRDEDAFELAKQAGYTYFSALYPRTREFRVHCAHGKILMVHEKPMPEKTDNIKECVKLFNNEDWEYIYWQDYDLEICKIALRAIKALNLDFGGVDVMAFPVDKKQPRQVVCEVNTAPTLYTYGSQRYAMYFDWLFSSAERREHVDFEGIKKASKLAWRKEEFLQS